MSGRPRAVPVFARSGWRCLWNGLEKLIFQSVMTGGGIGAPRSACVTGKYKVVNQEPPFRPPLNPWRLEPPRAPPFQPPLPPLVKSTIIQSSTTLDLSDLPFQLQYPQCGPPRPSRPIGSVSFARLPSVVKFNTKTDPSWDAAPIAIWSKHRDQHRHRLRVRHDSLSPGLSLFS